ncbi:SlyX family protein [Shewanella aestuarii]|uniref:Protein SlyX homolog n=1 Tax=Shewanella aestuarii TaxID=1028752 RepID=A0A6G9QNZ5_9GAMM|nr:SlyX family protein [Shewanella aestuarii]QIR15559.1 SlyX family protein [Shewanella aestuarii]
MEQLLAKIDDLETKISFQELTLEELNQEVIKLNDLVSRQQHQIMLMVNKMQAMEPSNMATQAEETPPPHY